MTGLSRAEKPQTRLAATAGVEGHQVSSGGAMGGEPSLMESDRRDDWLIIPPIQPPQHGEESFT